MTTVLVVHDRTLIALGPDPGSRSSGTPNGIRTRVAAVKGRCPRPLDDGGRSGSRERRYQPGMRTLPRSAPAFGRGCASVLGFKVRDGSLGWWVRDKKNCTIPTTRLVAPR